MSIERIPGEGGGTVSECRYGYWPSGTLQPPAGAFTWRVGDAGVRSRLAPPSADGPGRECVGLRGDGRGLFLHRPERAAGWPIYYAVRDGRLTVADSLYPMWRTGGVTVDPQWLIEVLVWGYPVTHRTPYLGVHQVLPGEWIEVDFAAAGVRDVSYRPTANGEPGADEDDDTAIRETNRPFTLIPALAAAAGAPAFCNQQLQLARAIDAAPGAEVELPHAAPSTSPRPGLRTVGLLKRRHLSRRAIRRCVRAIGRELDAAWRPHADIRSYREWLHGWRAVPAIRAPLHAYAAGHGKRLSFTGASATTADDDAERRGPWTIDETPFRNLFEYYQSLHYDGVRGMTRRWLKCDPWNTSCLVRAWRDGKDRPDACESLCLLALGLDWLARFSDVRCDQSLTKNNRQQPKGEV